MATFRIFKHPAGNYIAVKSGFSWPALVLGVLPFLLIIWFMYHNLWKPLAIWFSALVVLAILTPLLDVVALLAFFAFWLAPGFLGNEWRESNLRNRGYEVLRTIVAPNADMATAQAARDDRI